jgi:CIC family chloride channel protein
MSAAVVTLPADDALAVARRFLASGAPGAAHQGFPVVDGDGALVGVLTRRDLLDPQGGDERLLASLLKRPPVVAFADGTLRDVVDAMARADVGRLPVVERARPRRVVGIVTRGDVVTAEARRLAADERLPRSA